MKNTGLNKRIMMAKVCLAALVPGLLHTVTLSCLTDKLRQSRANGNTCACCLPVMKS